MFRILWDRSSGSIKRTQNITSNFSEARLILPKDGSQRIRNMSELLSFKILIHVDFNLLSFIQLSALVGQ